MKDKPADIRELLTAESIAAYREHVIEECALVVDDYASSPALSAAKASAAEYIATAIRALKDKP